MQVIRTEMQYGAIKARIRSAHLIKCPDGVAREFTVEDRAAHPTAKTQVICFCCKGNWKTEQEFLAEHVNTYDKRESHAYAWVRFAEWEVDKDKKPIKPEFETVLGLLSDRR